jgi:hypothetical protein
MSLSVQQIAKLTVQSTDFHRNPLVRGFGEKREFYSRVGHIIKLKLLDKPAEKDKPILENSGRILKFLKSDANCRIAVRKADSYAFWGLAIALTAFVIKEVFMKMWGFVPPGVNLNEIAEYAAIAGAGLYVLSKGLNWVTNIRYIAKTQGYSLALSVIASVASQASPAPRN